MQDMNPQAVVKDISLPLYNAKFWMKLIGVVMVIYGVLIALSIIGLVIAWLPIWIGVLLFQSAGAIEMAYAQGDMEAAIRGMEKLKVYFVINGVLLLIGVILGVAGIFLGGMGALMGMGAMGGG